MIDLLFDHPAAGPAEDLALVEAARRAGRCSTPSSSDPRESRNRRQPGA